MSLFMDLWKARESTREQMAEAALNCGGVAGDWLAELQALVPVPIADLLDAADACHEAEAAWAEFVAEAEAQS